MSLLLHCGSVLTPAPFSYQSGTKFLKKGPNFNSVANLLAFYYFHGPYDLKAMGLPTWISLQLPL
jgi:hypothetical protein